MTADAVLDLVRAANQRILRLASVLRTQPTGPRMPFIEAFKTLLQILVTLVLTALAILFLVFTRESSGAEAQPIAGKPAVIDATTLRLDGGRIRLHGVVTPSPVELMPSSATAVLEILVRDTPTVSCAPRGLLADGTIAAVCHTTTGLDLGGALVGSGFAKSDPAIALYGNAQDRARALRLGIWRN